VADVVVLVARAGQTRYEGLRQSTEMLEHQHLNVAGVVLVGVTSVPNAYYYYYTSSTARAAKSATKQDRPGSRSPGPGDPRAGSPPGPAAPSIGGNGAGDNGKGGEWPPAPTEPRLDPAAPSQ
jgi:Mrp family chromosome partitioning ATPase